MQMYSKITKKIKTFNKKINKKINKIWPLVMNNQIINKVRKIKFQNSQPMYIWNKLLMIKWKQKKKTKMKLLKKMKLI